ncbi:MAG TPA: choice-of-anchor tandem repeat GloVer-containing protein, partial [Candidatus Tumulicola sp.]
SSPSVNGSGPYGVIASANGTLFGATGSGGTYTSGILYMLVPSGRSYKQKVLHSMTGSDGTEPGLLAMDKAGALYGSAIYGGSGGALCGTAGCGVVFKLTPSAGGSYSYSVLRNFAGGADGIGPMGRLAIASNGTLYGATIEGGVATAQCQQGCGTIFSLTPSGRAYRYKVLYRFRGGADGEYPMGGVVVGATAATQSQLFGVTSGGGDVAECYTPQSVPGCGTVYAFASGKKTTLYGFRGYTFNDGEIPAAGLTATATGLLGTTSLGGNQTAYNSVGTIWSIAYSGTGYTTLHNFDGVEYGTDGRSPDSPLTQFGNAYVTSIQQGGGSKACGFYGCGVLVALTL